MEKIEESVKMAKPVENVLNSTKCSISKKMNVSLSFYPPFLPV